MQALAASLKDENISLLEAIGDGADLCSQQYRASLLIGLLVDGVAGGILRPSRFIECIQEIDAFKEVGTENYELGDALWMAWCLEGRNTEAAERLVAVSTGLMDKGCLSRRILMELSDGEFMEAVGLVSSYKDGWRKREIRLNTRNVYAQTKFNMLREESEGYSKLLTLLNQSGEAQVSKENLPAILMEIKSLIGYFDLDPNRVSSIILDVFAARPNNEAFIDLIDTFGIHKSVEFLGFRLAGGEPVPKGLHKAAALLVSRGVINLEDLVAQFPPVEEEYEKWRAERSSQLDESVKKIGVVSLASKAGDDTPVRRAGQTARTIELDTKPFRKLFCDGDQRLEFLGHLLECGGWDESMILVKHLKDRGVNDVASCESVGRALCAILDAELDNLIESIDAENAPKPDSVELSQRALTAIRLLGHHLHFDLRVFAKVLNLVSEMIGSHQEKKELALELLLGTLLPAFNLVPSSVAMANALWSKVLTKLTYPERFCIYAEFIQLVAESPLLLASEKLAETEARRVLRRVTAPTNNKDTKKTMRPIGRLLAKIAHANPFAVCRQLLRQVMGMPGMVASISESLKYLTPMAFDVLTFSIVRQLSSGKRKLKEDGVNLEEWFQWLALFTGIVCRTQRNVEVTALAQLVANNLKQSESLDLLVLKEIITSMTRISPTVDVSNQQLDALAGSQALIQYVVGEEEGGKEIGGKTKDPARVLQRLLAALRQGPEKEQLLLPLLLLLAQQKTLITLHPPSKHLKLAAELVDKCQEVTMQYIEFLQKSLSSSEYQALLPSIEDLAVDYKIDPEIIMQLYRPILRKIKPFSGVSYVDTGGVARTVGDVGEEDGEVGACTVEPNGDTSIEDAVVGVSSGIDTDAITWSEIQGQMTKLAPNGAFVGISWDLFGCFWAFELPDLRVPKARYEGTLKQISTSVRNLEDDIASRGGSQFGGGQQQSTELPLEKLRSELAQLKTLAEVLPVDMKAQSVNVAQVSRVFELSSRSWVRGADKDGCGGNHDAAATWVDAQSAAAREFVQHCMLPRLLISPRDAIYCVEFLKRAHKLDSPGFRLLLVLDRLFKELAFMARCTTERESINLGIFFGELMGMVSSWRKKSVFEKECASSESFKVFEDGELKPLTFAEWTHLTASWSSRLFEVASACMGGGYMEMKNILLILNRCTRVYPSTREDAEALLAVLRPISNEDPREDLKTLARMYCTSLEMSMRDRQMVQTRQEYAGGKPPPKSKKKTEETSKKPGDTLIHETRMNTVKDNEESASNNKAPQHHAAKDQRTPNEGQNDPVAKGDVVASKSRREPRGSRKDAVPSDKGPKREQTKLKSQEGEKNEKHPRQDAKRTTEQRKRKREEDPRHSHASKESKQPGSIGKVTKGSGRENNNVSRPKEGKSSREVRLKDARDSSRPKKTTSKTDERRSDRREDRGRDERNRRDERSREERNRDERNRDERSRDERNRDTRNRDTRSRDDHEERKRDHDGRKRSRSDRDRPNKDTSNRDRSDRDRPNRRRPERPQEDRPVRRRRN